MSANEHLGDQFPRPKFNAGESLAWHNPETGEHGKVEFVRHGDSQATAHTSVVKLDGQGKRVETRHLQRIW